MKREDAIDAAATQQLNDLVFQLPRRRQFGDAQNSGEILFAETLGGNTRGTGLGKANRFGSVLERTGLEAIAMPAADPHNSRANGFEILCSPDEVLRDTV